MRFLAAALVLIALLASWMLRYEKAEGFGLMHRNRFTGAVCPIEKECWWRSELPASFGKRD